ncbi:MAG TPA: SRPBCC domain-containing protein [Chitinophagaceae bacterium]|nr:SRPBCC domain-containing protein [Chitinophagaceae bacterium]
MAQIFHRVGIKSSVQQCYEGLSTIAGIAGWWTEETSGVSEVGETITVRFNSPEGQELGSMTMQVRILDPGRKVQWTFVTGPEEWVGTDVSFDLHQENDYTIVLFKHSKWREEVEFMAHCSMKWAIFLLSLKNFIETGKGSPSPQDIKIDNWN